MNKTILSIMACAMAFAGCTVEMDQPAPVQSDYLVIEAVCPTLTKTDMTEGNSSWDAGDVITVVYDGAAYEYVASAAGETTTFTSTAGITSYDASKPITAYYPATDVTGKVKIEAEKSVVFAADAQVTRSCAPLVGTPKSDNLSNGVLNMVFENIFSVLELRIDAGDLAGTVKSLTIEPASASDFDGYISVEGTVDPESLAVTPSASGQSLKVVLPETADPKKAMTLKIPVGRFTTNSGLKVTYETSESTFTRVVFKTGLTSYEKDKDVYRAKHIAKPMYAFVQSLGGISTAQELLDFAAAVNSGAPFTRWMNDEGKVVLLDDIDLSGVSTWTPVGEAVLTWTSNALTKVSGNPFTGYFDGKGKKIKGLKMKSQNAVKGANYGFFGTLADGAVVENLEFDSSCSIELASTAATDCGVVAGLVWDGTVRNIVNNAAMSYTGTSDNVKTTLAVVGMCFAQDRDVVIENIVNHGAVTAVSGGTSENGGNAVQVAGILGFGTNHANSSNKVQVKECVNRGNIESATGRASGIVAACNRHTIIRGCENYGHNVNSFNVKTESAGSAARIGNITCITGAGSAIYDSVNYGDVISTTKGAIAGVICLINADDNVLDNVATYGRVITDRKVNSYCGIFFGQCNKKATITDCVAGGAFGLYNGGEYQVTEMTAENYWDYIGQIGSNGVNATQTNIVFGTASK